MKMSEQPSGFGMPLSEIPNQAGFRFVGITHEGLEIECQVIKKDGWHTAVDSDQVSVWHRLKGWRSIGRENKV